MHGTALALYPRALPILCLHGFATAAVIVEAFVSRKGAIEIYGAATAAVMTSLDAYIVEAFTSRIGAMNILGLRLHTIQEVHSSRCRLHCIFIVRCNDTLSISRLEM
jgi:hypothetical protein